jgi:hypothetical protein
MPIRSACDLERFNGIVNAQYGVITRSQALRCRVTHSMISYRLRPDGPWQQILPAVYLTVTGTPTSDQRDAAALLYAGPASMLTGAVAVRRHGLTCAGLNTLDVLVPASNRRKSQGFVRLHRTTRMPERMHQTGPIRFTLLPRAIADAARDMNRFSDVEALVAQAVQRRRCSLAELACELTDGPSNGSRLLRRALAEVGSGIWSSAEGDLKRLLERSGLETPVYNALLYGDDATFLGCADLWWPRAGVAAEVDSRKYHLSPQGYANTMRRHNRMTKAGIVVLHWLRSTIKNEPDSVISDLRDAIEGGNQRPRLPIRTILSSQAGDGAA